MTKEELREHCEKQVKACEMWAENRGQKPSGKIYEEHKLILDLIKALEQQPSDDCVSRQAVNEYLEKLLDGRFDDFMSAAIIGIKDNINAMSPVTPTRKIGNWIGEEEGYYSECSCCGASFLWEDYKYIGDWKYCPKCGSKMSDIPTGSD